MKRCLQGAVAMLAICSAVPALGADYLEYPMPGDLRPAYPETWKQPEDSIRFEFGNRYWMSWGKQDAEFPAIMGGINFGNVGISTSDRTDIGELHGKIEDLSTQTYVRAIGGLGFNTTGTYAVTPGASSGDIGKDSRIGYAGADFGWLPLGDMRGGAALGGLIGYHYWKDAPDFGTGQVAASFAGGVPATFASAKDNLDIHALRLGVKAQAEFDMFDIQAEVAAIPYAQVTGSVGGSSPGGFNFPGAPGVFYENQATTLSGRGYGVMAEGMVGFHPSENLAIRVGGRAWYLQGQLDAVFNGSVGGVAQPAVTLQSAMASVFRYGALFELTGKF